MESGGRSGKELVTALGSAWTTAGLYADVAHREPFVASAEVIAAWRGADLQVRSTGFVLSGEPLAGPDAAERMANALFLHGVEAIGFSSELTPESLARLFQVVGLAPEVVADQGGLDAMAGDAALAGIRLTMRSQLMGLGGDAPGDRAVGDDDFGDLPIEESFFERLESAASRTDADERTAAVMGLVDGFTLLAPEQQADLIDQLLGIARQDLRDLFLDQLAPEDLAKVVPHLEPAAYRVLGEYVSYVEGPRQGELTDAMGDPASVLKFRARVAESVRDRMTGIRLTQPSEPMADLAADPDGWFESSVEVMTGLALVEDKPDRQERVAETWQNRVSVSLAGREDDKALAWYRSIIDLDDPPEPIAEKAEEVPDEDEIRDLVGRKASIPAREFVDLLMDRDPARVVGPLVETGSGQEALGELAANDPEAVLTALESAADPMPMIVALKAAGYQGADPRLVALLDKPGVHGRSEVLLLVGRTLGVERLGRLLVDDDPAVRRQAAELLRRGRTDAGSRLLFERFQSADVEDDEREMLAHLLAATDDGRALLQDIAGRAGLLLSGSGRRVRAAARAALDAAEAR